MGAVREKVYAATSVAVNVDWLNPNGSAFKLVDVFMNIDDVPSDDENVTITAILPDSLSTVIPLHVFNPSLSTAQTHDFPFSGRQFPAGTTITVDYANTGTDAIVIGLTYEEVPK